MPSRLLGRIDRWVLGGVIGGVLGGVLGWFGCRWSQGWCRCSRSRGRCRRDRVRGRVHGGVRGGVGSGVRGRVDRRVNRRAPGRVHGRIAGRVGRRVSRRVGGGVGGGRARHVATRPLAVRLEERDAAVRLAHRIAVDEVPEIVDGVGAARSRRLTNRSTCRVRLSIGRARDDDEGDHSGDRCRHDSSCRAIGTQISK